MTAKEPMGVKGKGFIRFKRTCLKMSFFLDNECQLPANFEFCNWLKVFDYDHGTKDIGVRRYIWLAEYDYVLILQKKKKALFWVTAYYVDSDGGRKDLSRRYEKRL